MSAGRARPDDAILPEDIWKDLSPRDAFTLGSEYESIRSKLYCTQRPVRHPVSVLIAEKLSLLYRLAGCRAEVFWIHDDVTNMRYVYVEPPPDQE